MIDVHDLLIAGRMTGGGSSPAPEPVIIPKTIAENGAYAAADEGADGYSTVTAAVPLQVPGNLFDFAAKDVTKGFVNNAILSPDAGSSAGWIAPTQDQTGRYWISEYIPISPSTTYILCVPGNTWDGGGYVLYDSNKDIIAYIRNQNKEYKEFTTTSNSAYIRVSIADVLGLGLTGVDFDRLVILVQKPT